MEITTKIPRQCEFDIAVDFETIMGAGNWLLKEPKEKYVPVVVPHAMVKADSPVLKVRVLNTTKEQVKIYVNMHIAIAK